MIEFSKISARQQNKWSFAKHDTISFSGFLALRHGSIVMHKIRSVEISEKRQPCFWTRSRALVAQRTGALLRYQTQKCYGCEKGILLQSAGGDAALRGPRRQMFCLEGIEDPEWCSYPLQRVLDVQHCPLDNEPMWP